MTIDECAKTLRHLNIHSTCPNCPSVEDHLRALIYGESERAAGMLRETANSDEVTSMCCSDDTGNLLDALAAHILSTSPGKPQYTGPPLPLGMLDMKDRTRPTSPEKVGG